MGCQKNTTFLSIFVKKRVFCIFGQFWEIWVGPEKVCTFLKKWWSTLGIRSPDFFTSWSVFSGFARFFRFFRFFQKTPKSLFLTNWSSKSGHFLISSESDLLFWTDPFFQKRKKVVFVFFGVFFFTQKSGFFLVFSGDLVQKKGQKTPKKGSFLTPFWPVFDPFFDRFWTVFWGVLSLCEGFFIFFENEKNVKKSGVFSSFFGCFWPLFDPFWTTFWPIFGPFLEGFNADLTGKTDKKGCQKLTHFVVTHLGRVSKIPGCQISGFGGLGMGPGWHFLRSFFDKFLIDLRVKNGEVPIKKVFRNDPF